MAILVASMPVETQTPPGYDMLFLINMLFLTNQAGTPLRADIVRVNPSFLMRAHNVYGTCGPGAAVRAGGLDTGAYAYDSALLGKQLSWNGLTFIFGPADGPSALGRTTVALPRSKYGSLNLPATAIQGNQPNQTFMVSNADGARSVGAARLPSLPNWSVGRYPTRTAPGHGGKPLTADRDR